MTLGPEPRPVIPPTAADSGQRPAARLPRPAYDGRSLTAAFDRAAETLTV
ncbi:hypothetical protein [Actinacidiphila glaucinigra]